MLLDRPYLLKPKVSILHAPGTTLHLNDMVFVYMKLVEPINFASKNGSAEAKTNGEWVVIGICEETSVPNWSDPKTSQSSSFLGHESNSIPGRSVAR